ncbi:hypothetical protein [Halococcus agarilyticus]|uniref:hypothetical protein n=1 Tax=Halococcus agarilyticus TaxID=1232219 RepID=UPI0012AC22CA|nr:hypothetical protein [Halococcus agarilyticus]
MEEVERAVDDLVGHLRAGRRGFALETMGVSALDGLYASVMGSLVDADPIKSARTKQARRLITEFGAAERSAVGLHAPLSSLVDGPIAVLQASDRTPTVSIKVDDEFGALRVEQREEIVQKILAPLAQAVDLRLIATGRWQRKLVKEYHTSLPGVSDRDIAHPYASQGEVAEQVEAARDTLDPDGRETTILRSIGSEASKATSYHSLYADAQVSDSRVRQCLGVLADYDLVTRFDGPEGRMVELLVAGRQYLETLEEEISVQQQLSDCVSEPGNRSGNSRVSPHAHGAPPQPGDGGGSDGVERSRYHQVRPEARYRAAAVAAAAVEGGVTVADHPIAPKDDPEEPHWHYDERDDRLVIGAEYRNPMQWWVCVALALADPRTWEHALPPERLEDGKVGDLLVEHTDLLRNSRCLGYLADRNATGEDYRDALLEAAEDLREMTRDLHHRNYSDRDSFRGDVIREALGLAGTIVHLCDLADVEVIREVRIPEFSRNFKESDERDLARTINKGAIIQSRYREFAAYRQLFETREKKVRNAIPPAVDAASPYGELIGSFVVVGKGIGEAFADRLSRQIGAGKPREDAPEFAVPVPVKVIDGSERDAHAQTVRLLCRQKSLTATRETISVLAALTGTPWDTAAALRNLASENRELGRELRLDEVRFALMTLPHTRIVPDMSKPALSKIVHRLLTAESPLSQSELAELADVSARSVRNHTEYLAAFDFIRDTDEGWRFTLPFRESERGETVLPWFTATGSDEHVFVRDVLAEAVHQIVSARRYADPEDPIGGALCAGPGDVVPALQETCEWLDPWIDAVCLHLSVDQQTEPSRYAIAGTIPGQTTLDVEKRSTP